jgi:hypothetical protein
MGTAVERVDHRAEKLEHILADVFERFDHADAQVRDVRVEYFFVKSHRSDLSLYRLGL